MGLFRLRTIVMDSVKHLEGRRAKWRRKSSKSPDLGLYRASGRGQHSLGPIAFTKSYQAIENKSSMFVGFYEY